MASLPTKFLIFDSPSYFYPGHTDPIAYRTLPLREHTEPLPYSTLLGHLIWAIRAGTAGTPFCPRDLVPLVRKWGGRVTGLAESRGSCPTPPAMVVIRGGLKIRLPGRREAWGLDLKSSIPRGGHG